jgi:hypothetical protein
MPPTPMEATWNIEFGDRALRMAGAEMEAEAARDCWRKWRRFIEQNGT